jgi:hypothetical protein
MGALGVLVDMVSTEVLAGAEARVFLIMVSTEVLAGAEARVFLML